MLIYCFMTSRCSVEEGEEERHFCFYFDGDDVVDKPPLFDGIVCCAYVSICADVPVDAVLKCANSDDVVAKECQCMFVCQIMG